VITSLFSLNRCSAILAASCSGVAVTRNRMTGRGKVRSLMMTDIVAVDIDDSSYPERRLTVVIPHFNQKDFLPRAAASALRSEACELEIVIVDDGSTDGSEAVLAALELNPSITVIRCKSNQGVAAALNTGLAATRSRYVTFLGADDLVLPNLYAPLLRSLEDHPAAALGCGQLAVVGSDGSIRGIRPITPPSLGAEYFDPRTICHRIKRTDHWIAATTTVFRTDLLRTVGGFDTTLGVFCDIIVARILAFQHGFVYVPGVRAIFRVAANTLSGSTLLDQNENARQLAIALDRLATTAVGQQAPDYPALFARRMRFSAARLQLVWNGRNADPGTVVAVAGGNDVDMKALNAISRISGFGKTGRLLTLGWLTLRLRPFSLLHLMAHMVRNRFTLNRNRRHIADWMNLMEDARRDLMKVCDRPLVAPGARKDFIAARAFSSDADSAERKAC
jgi:glycosyltransferase involved in cell wall biosynthesis